MTSDDDEPRPAPRHILGDDLSHLSVAELTALREACLAEAERIAAEIAAKDSSRSAAHAVFKL